MILTKALSEVFSLTLSPANPDQLAAMARQIRTNFWQFRLEEVTYVLNRGINGGYGKMFGHLNYVQISEWLQIYDLDREDLIIEEQKRLQSMQRDDMKAWGVDFQPLIDKLKQDRLQEKSEEPLDIEIRDRQQLAFVQAFADGLSIDKLEEFRRDAVVLGFKSTAKYLQDKISDK